MEDFATAAASLNELDRSTSTRSAACTGSSWPARSSTSAWPRRRQRRGRRPPAGQRARGAQARRAHRPHVAIKLGARVRAGGEDLEPLAVHLPDWSPSTLLPFIVQGELAGDAGYQRWADNEPDPDVQRLLRLNGREETIHSERVSAVLELLQP